ncbi:zinc-binding dehydrogenase [Planomonospora venezuelensis]|uniref:zinc-binding dehydrogenase n=1 Tax=Planomonospora venezuelensis TaxID=1999 RepID=UPI0021AAF658|nr:zinc-binding dehydrogenase [Planomonospora venezuelensis]
MVAGASGGVGSHTMQLPAARGATVVATGTRDDVERLTELGASFVVDYTAEAVSEQVRAAYPDSVDTLIDLVSTSLTVWRSAPLARAARSSARWASSARRHWPPPASRAPSSSPTRPAASSPPSPTRLPPKR